MSRDWRDSLDAESAEKLNQAIVSVLKHRKAYDSAGDPRFVQLWLTFLELYKRQIALERRLNEVEDKLFGKKKADSVLSDLENY